MIVDVHAAFSITGDCKSTIDRVVEAGEAAGIERSWIANLSAAERGENIDEPDANLACLSVCGRNAEFAPVYALRPTAVDSNIHAIAGALDTEPFVAAAFWPAQSGIDVDDTRMDRYLPLLAKLNCPLLIHVSRDERCKPARLHALAKRARNLKMIVCPTDSSSWSDALDLVGRASKRDEAIMALTTSHATPAQVKRAVERVGVARVLFGTDSGGDHAQSEASKSFLHELRESVGEESFRLITGENALALEKARRTPN